MFITPNSTVQLYSRILLDKEHRNTLYFANAQAQDEFFSSNNYLVATYNNYTFLRDFPNRITLEIKTEGGIGSTGSITFAQLSRCNYMRFKNTSYFNKWFYAFIDNIEYVNNGAANVYFTIDVMQSWLLNYDYGTDDCLIEREHTRTDQIGDNLIPENMATGDYVYGDQVYPTYVDDEEHLGLLNFEDCSLVVACPWKATYQYDSSGQTDIDKHKWVFTEAGASYYGQCNVGGACYYVFENTASGIQMFYYFIVWLNRDGKGNSILAISWMPSAFVKNYPGGLIPDDYLSQRWNAIFQYKRTISASVASYFGYTGSPAQNTANIDGYVPKNKKLFTYPYNFLSVYLPSGENIEYKYERFEHGVDDSYVNGGVCEFKCFGAISPETVVECYPENYYKGNYKENGDRGFSIQSYPLVSYVTDAYLAYVAQQKAAFYNPGTVGQVLSTVLSFGLNNQINSYYNPAMSLQAIERQGRMERSPAYGQGAVAGISVANSYFSYQRTKEAIKKDAVRVQGTASSPTNLQSQMCAPVFRNKHITAEFAKIIDDYFSAFGYACGEIKAVSPNNRRYFTFVKTCGCSLKYPPFPHDVESEICSILDNGITFWKDHDNIGNIALNNTPIDEM